MPEHILVLSPETEQWFRILLIAATLLLIPITVGFLVVFFKAAFLLHSVYELVTVARYELYPLLKDLRLTVDNVEDITHRAQSGIQDLGYNIRQIKPNLKYGTRNVKTGVQAFVTGLTRSFVDR